MPVSSPEAWRWYSLFLHTHSFSAEFFTENAFPFHLFLILIRVQWISQRSIIIWKLYYHFISISIGECITIVTSGLLCQLVWIVFRFIHHVSIYIDKIPHLATAASRSVLLHPKHDHFGCFSCFSLLVSSWTVKLLVILQYVTSLALVFITYPYART